MNAEGPPNVVDTVVLLSFLLVEEMDLLLELVGRPLRVPLSVYDPGERDLPGEALRRPELLSEIRQSMRHYEVAEKEQPDQRQLAKRMSMADQLHADGLIQVTDLTVEEELLAARLQSREGARVHGVRAPLGPGEAACVALAWSRGWTIVTDDDAALRVLTSLSKGVLRRYERIRKLLIRAAESDMITKERANDIHRQMRGFGFWDSVAPFP